MMICLVTDRRRLGAAIGARPADWIDALRAAGRAAARAGVDFVQIREPDLEAGRADRAGSVDHLSNAATPRQEFW